LESAKTSFQVGEPKLSFGSVREVVAVGLAVKVAVGLSVVGLADAIGRGVSEGNEAAVGDAPGLAGVNVITGAFWVKLAIKVWAAWVYNSSLEPGVPGGVPEGKLQAVATISRQTAMIALAMGIGCIDIRLTPDVSIISEINRAS
jgi:hypothetical protein